jgi:TPR repeat protein
MRFDVKLIRLMAALALSAALPLHASAATPDAITKCDRLAAHPEDPDHLGIGVPSKKVNLPKAVAECERELKKQPDNPRIRYQYARVLAYSGRWAEAAPLMKQAADAGYRQAQFVYGLFVDRGREGAPRDVCVAEQYWLKAARNGRQHARVLYVDEYLKGRFQACRSEASRAEIETLLEAAKADASEFYERLLIANLQRQLAEQSNE